MDDRKQSKVYADKNIELIWLPILFHWNEKKMVCWIEEKKKLYPRPIAHAAHSYIHTTTTKIVYIDSISKMSKRN